MRAILLTGLVVLGCSGGSSYSLPGDPEETTLDGTGGSLSPGGSGGQAEDAGGSGGNSGGGMSDSGGSGGAQPDGGSPSDGGEFSGGASSGGQETGGVSSGGESSGGEASVGGSPAGGSGSGGSPLVTDGECVDESQTVLEVPPGTCVQVWGMFELGFTPECTAFPEATCADWDYHVEDTANPPSSTESVLIYVNRRADCGVQWEAEWHDGACP